MWFRDDHQVVRRRKRNRRRRTSRQPLLMVSARVADRRRERMHRVSAVVLSLLVLGASAWLLLAGIQWLGRVLFVENGRYTITKLDLSSDGKLRPQHIREYGGLAEGANLFAVNLDQVRSDLQSVPLVNTVEVSRRLPGTLIVRLTERIALARLGKDEERSHLAIDREGHVLGPSSRTPGLPAITGLRDRGLRPGSYIDEQLVRDALTVLDIIDTTRLSQVVRVATIDVRHPEYLDIRLHDGERVVMGRDRLDWRLTRLAQSLQTAAQLGRSIMTIDLTVNKNPPVEWR